MRTLRIFDKSFCSFCRFCKSIFHLQCQFYTLREYDSRYNQYNNNIRNIIVLRVEPYIYIYLLLYFTYSAIFFQTVLLYLCIISTNKNMSTIIIVSFWKNTFWLHFCVEYHSVYTFIFPFVRHLIFDVYTSTIYSYVSHNIINLIQTPLQFDYNINNLYYIIKVPSALYYVQWLL